MVIPTFNEGDTIGAVLDELDSVAAAWGRTFDVVVVDDGSQDATADQVARRGVRFLRNPGPKGKGASLRYGFRQTTGETVIMMDGDGSHRAVDIPALVGELERDPDVGLVIASRIIGGSDEYSRIRALGNIVLTGLFGLLFRRYLSDALNGFKALRRPALRLDTLRCRSFGIETELIAHTLGCGRRVVEIPSHERARQGGRPKSKVFRHGFVLAWSILVQYWKFTRRGAASKPEEGPPRESGAGVVEGARWEIVVADPLDEAGLEVLRSDPRVLLDYRPSVSPEQLPEFLRSAHALIVRGRTRVNAELLRSAPNLIVVGRAGSGLDNIDVSAAAEFNITVVNAAEGNAISTAELTILHMLGLARDYWRAVGTVKRGGWDRRRFLGTELDGKTLGVIGLGAVGRAVARRAAMLGMKVLGYDPDAPLPSHCSKAELKDLVAASDYVSVHVPLTSATMHLLDATMIDSMKKGAFLINCSRGGVVDEDALLKALDRGDLGGAAFDVFETEPPENAVLAGREDVLATPHIGAATREARRKTSLQVIRKVLQILTERSTRVP